MSLPKENVQMADVALLNYSTPEDLSADLMALSIMKCKWIVTSSDKEKIRTFLPTLYRHRNIIGSLNDCSLLFSRAFLIYHKLQDFDGLGT